MSDNLKEINERMKAEGYMFVGPGESYQFTVEGHPFRVSGPCTVSPTGVIGFELSGSWYYTLNPADFAPEHPPMLATEVKQPERIADTWVCSSHPPGLEVNDIPVGEKCPVCQFGKPNG